MRTLHVIPTLAAALIAAPFSTPAAAQNRDFDISSMRDQGVNINGAVALDQVGDTMSCAGDLNNDGFDDVIVTAWRRSISSVFNTGKAWIVFGGATMPGTSISVTDPGVIELLADTTQSGGFSGPEFGFSAAAAGDVNNDGFDDVLVGSPRSDPNGTDSGIAYLIYGSATLPSVIDSQSLGSLGVVFEGVSGGDLAGTSVGGAGDVNNDGFDDIIIGAQGSDPNGSSSGSAYVVYGSATLPSTFALSDMSTMSGLGVLLEGGAQGDRLGEQSTTAGDFNNDGFDDILVSAPDADPNGKSQAGISYVVFGGSSLPDSIDMVGLGAAGVTINGETGGDFAGDRIAGGGDVNDDGFDDIMLGSFSIDTSNGANSGRAYLVYGSSSLSGTVEVSTLGSLGVIFTGGAANDNAGSALALNGDINGDGRDDIAIGVQTADPNAINSAGQVAVVFGNASLPASVDLDAIGGLGAVLDGLAEQDLNGSALDLGGNYDNDNFNDVLFSARQADPGGINNAGAAYILKGACHWAQIVGPAVEGGSIRMRAFGTSGAVFQLFVAFAELPAPLNTKFGPWQLAEPVFPIFILPYDALGEFDVDFPFPPSTPSAVGLEVFMHFLQTPQGDKCDLSNLVAFVIE